MGNNVENKLLTVKEFAEIAGVSVQSVYKMLIIEKGLNIGL